MLIRRVRNARDKQVISLKGRFLVTVNTMFRGVIVAGRDGTVIVLALDSDSPAGRENVVMGVGIDRLEVKTTKNRRDGQVVPIGQMHDRGCHVWVVRERGEQMVCMRLNLVLLTNRRSNGFDSCWQRKIRNALFPIEMTSGST